MLLHSDHGGFRRRYIPHSQNLPSLFSSHLHNPKIFSRGPKGMACCALTILSKYPEVLARHISVLYRIDPHLQKISGRMDLDSEHRSFTPVSCASQNLILLYVHQPSHISISIIIPRQISSMHALSSSGYPGGRTLAGFQVWGV